MTFAVQAACRADAALALDYLGAIVRGYSVDEHARWFVVPGRPAAKERPRVGRGGHVFTPGGTKAAEALVAMFWRAATRDQTLATNVAVAAVFVVADGRVKDGDNMLKLVLDAGNRAEVWPDDSFCTVSTWALELDRARPRTVVAFCPTKSSLVREAKKCSACGQPLMRKGKGLCRHCGTLHRGRAKR